MLGGDRDHDGRIADVEASDAMAHGHHCGGLGAGLLGDPSQCRLRIGVRAVLQSDHGRLGVRVVVAHATDEGRHRSQPGIFDRRQVCIQIESRFRYRCDSHVVHEWSPPST